ncbi:regulatory protein GemA [Bergeriella denitrificans]|uniref:Phage associated protein n=2 Tax=Bergeriella denitrificans TaxID=494 RepID=A0A378UFJ7_BERDE|nr:regulatory protein GemA [Bergeriella denitrificans]STZ74809.1 phage associated protein [Bergeriella denitrificans]STZ76097.1 phage associated protein [Bergeriella denitrificans]STZ83029.1 phage associated protein [Bergeriella denitrificans]STZ83073.1 phage associated protein [Bergeriella denitrificans]
METAAQKRSRLIKLLHVAKSKLLLADGDYRCLLANVSQGKTSSTKLSLEELELALRAMKARGFVVAAKPQGGGADIPVFEPQEDMAGQVKKIRALWLELHRLGAVRNPSELALAKFVKRMTGVDYQGWLDVDNASKVIEHLKKWVLRVVGTV